mgnify:CR=1 FL=1
MGLGAGQEVDNVKSPSLEHIRTVFLDLDGVVWYGPKLIPHAAGFVRSLRASGRRVCFVTNITSSTAAMVAERLSRLGIETGEEDVQTPFTILPSHPAVTPSSRILLLGNRRIRQAVLDAGLTLTDDPEEASLVLVSRDTGLVYDHLAQAAQALQGGAQLLALNLDARVPVEGGKLVPGNGAIVAALTTATGVQAEAIGKPSKFYFDRALERFDADRSRTLMAGDNLDSDIRGGLDAGLFTVQVGGDRFSLLDPPPVPHLRVGNLEELGVLILDPVTQHRP